MRGLDEGFNPTNLDPNASLTMKLSGCQSFNINWLKGQLVTNENGGEFYIKDIRVDVANHEILIQFDDESSIPWDSIKNWSIQFQS